MVKLSISWNASNCWEDSSLIQLESTSHFESNSNWSLSNESFFKCFFISSFDKNWATSDWNSVRNCSLSASSISGSVGIIIFKSKTSASIKIVKSPWRPSSIASFISGNSSTVNYLLFREIKTDSMMNVVVWFDGSNSGESPATSTRSLVFYWCNMSLSIPVPRIISNTLSWNKLLSISTSFTWVKECFNIVVLSEFIESEVSEVIDAHFKWVTWVTVVDHNLFEIINEDLSSVDIWISLF